MWNLDLFLHKRKFLLSIFWWHCKSLCIWIMATMRKISTGVAIKNDILSKEFKLLIRLQWQDAKRNNTNNFHHDAIINRSYTLNYQSNTGRMWSMSNNDCLVSYISYINIPFDLVITFSGTLSLNPNWLVNVIKNSRFIQNPVWVSLV